MTKQIFVGCSLKPSENARLEQEMARRLLSGEAGKAVSKAALIREAITRTFPAPQKTQAK